MHRYAMLDERGIVENIVLYSDHVFDTPTLINIDEQPWVKIGKAIDDPSLKETPNDVIERRMKWLDERFERIEKKQFRSVCNLLKAQRDIQAANPEDEEIFEQCEREKAAYRSLYPITDSSGEDYEWQMKVLEKVREFSTK